MPVYIFYISIAHEKISSNTCIERDRYLSHSNIKMQDVHIVN